VSRTRIDVFVEPLASDLVAFAQCAALDASLFPHPSLPHVLDVTGLAPSVFVARRTANEPVIGFLGAVRSGGTLDIVGIGVAPDHRRHGVGRALVRAAVASAQERSITKLVLHVSTGNEAAVLLYTAEGFRVTRTLRGYYSARRFPNGGDAFEMTLVL
jgi:ribosomal protein S18 acetylase RimI-like enzyme